MTDWTGQQIGKYKINELVDAGGMGKVYKAYQLSLERDVAIKTIHTHSAKNASAVERFRREAQVVAALRHPGIVPVFAVGEAAGTPFFAMELVEGTTLRDVLAARRDGQDQREDWQTWAVETVARVGQSVCYAHGEGILHRDVKPANILLGSDGSPRLTDFGLAQDLRSPGLTQTGEVFGSPHDLTFALFRDFRGSSPRRD